MVFLEGVSRVFSTAKEGDSLRALYLMENIFVLWHKTLSMHCFKLLTYFRKHVNKKEKIGRLDDENRNVELIVWYVH